MKRAKRMRWISGSLPPWQGKVKGKRVVVRATSQVGWTSFWLPLGTKFFCGTPPHRVGIIGRSK